MSQTVLLGGLRFGSGQDRHAAGLLIRKIAGVKNLAHEKTLPFYEVHISRIGSDGVGNDLRERNSTKGLVGELPVWIELVKAFAQKVLSLRSRRSIKPGAQAPGKRSY